MLTKDFMPLLPSLLPLPKVNTLCENRNKDDEYHFNIKKMVKSDNAFGNHTCIEHMITILV
jgi:hypothetical protein